LDVRSVCGLNIHENPFSMLIIKYMEITWSSECGVRSSSTVRKAKSREGNSTFPLNFGTTLFSLCSHMANIELGTPLYL
jgi:hypothetical protein